MSRSKAGEVVEKRVVCVCWFWVCRCIWWRDGWGVKAVAVERRERRANFDIMVILGLCKEFKCMCVFGDEDREREREAFV